MSGRTIGRQVARIAGATALAPIVVIATVLATITAVYGLNAIFGNHTDCGDMCGLGVVVGLYLGVPLSVITVPAALFFYWRRTRLTPPKPNLP
jgi:hypothetical protein